jgi:AcrR family transcriptional regulator
MPRTPEQFEKIRSEKKEVILEAALRVFSADGYHNSSISKVSKEAGISKGLMYNYFKSKEELLKILIGSLLDEENKRAMEILEKPVSDETMTELIQTSTQILKKSPLKWKLYLNMANQPEVIDIVMEHFSSSRMLWFNKLMEYFTAKGVEDPLNEIQFFSSSMLGMKTSYLNDPDNFPIEEIEKRIIKLFIH